MNLATSAQVMGDYFGAMGIPLLRGRYFRDADNAGAQLVLIVNRKLAQHYWPNQDPIGKRLRVGTAEMQTPWLTVVGEVADEAKRLRTILRRSNTLFHRTKPKAPAARSLNPTI